MEHLPIHLPHEAALGGPVQFIWMYPFERFMKSLKGKAKNLARVEGSIVEGSLTEETSHFTSYYFRSSVRTKRLVLDAMTMEVLHIHITFLMFQIPFPK